MKRAMKRACKRTCATCTGLLTLSLLALAPALAASDSHTPTDSAAEASHAAARNDNFVREEVRSSGALVVRGRRLEYDSVAGTLIVHAKGWDDVPQNADPDEKSLTAQASMFYVAYFRKSTDGRPRPVTFIYNGGPGSASLWLHLGAFGPKRILTTDHAPTRPAPYSLVGNDATLLDVSDLVFIDAPGTGFSRIAGKDREKAFYGVDADAHAFADFIDQFLTRYSRWNSPKYLLGESYGTTRSGALAAILENDHAISLNGVILISQCLSYDSLPDLPALNPGIDLPYSLVLPTYAATAWFHHRLDDARPLETVLQDAEEFALGDYASALFAGNTLAAARRHAVAAHLHALTGLSVEYLERADLRVVPGAFLQELLRDQGRTAGRLDTRFAGPSLDPQSKEAQYDPQSAAISSAYVSAVNQYVRDELKFGSGRTYRLSADTEKVWVWEHQPPGTSEPIPQAVNVLPDLAQAMKYNPNLAVMLNAGYYDLATPYFEGVFELNHLPIPAELQAKIEIRRYQSGHMLYVNEEVLQALHDNIAAFIDRNGGGR